ncbi:MAG: hypothetical protein JSS04_09435 [Proteobacteria bacterium]|nr:hypothetical protein [Pseudomonadota bacterium]
MLLDRPAPPIPTAHACYFCGEDLSAVRSLHWGRNSERLYCSRAHLAKGETYVLEQMQDLTRLVGV